MHTELVDFTKTSGAFLEGLEGFTMQKNIKWFSYILLMHITN